MATADRLIILPAAERDMQKGYDWYEEKRDGLGREFLLEVEKTFTAILRSPKVFTKIKDDFRRAIVKRFPYVVFYEYASDCVTVYAVFHSSQDPKKWMTRLA